MRVSTVEYFQKSLDNMLLQQSKTLKLQDQVATGKKITKASDDPVGTVRSFQIRQDLLKHEQYLKNSEDIRHQLETQESTLDSVVNHYHRLKELAVSVNNSVLSSAERNAIAVEMREVLDNLVRLSNTTNGRGEYLFSGFKSLTKPVSVTGNVYQFQGDDGARAIQLSENHFIEVNQNAKSIFFDIDNARLNTSASYGAATITSIDLGLVNSGALPILNADNLTLNEWAISATQADGVSTTDAASSSIAIAQAINSNYADHGVRAVVENNTFDMGIYNQQPIAAGELEINGISIIDPVGSEASLLDAINDQSALTGITATQPAGVGTAIILTATDGRNIQLQSSGGSTASFTQLDLTGAGFDQVKRGLIRLQSSADILVGGTLPVNAGFNAGTQSVSANSGTLTVQSIDIIDYPESINETYSIVFGQDGETYSIYANSNPEQFLEGYEDIAYTVGDEITFNGIRLQLTGGAATGDIIQVALTEPPPGDIFSSTEQLIHSVSNYSGQHARLNYEVGSFLETLDSAYIQINAARAQIGAQMNIVDAMKSSAESARLIAQKTLSSIEDVDYTVAVSQLSQNLLALQISQQTFSKIQSLSLFNFL